MTSEPRVTTLLLPTAFALFLAACQSSLRPISDRPSLAGAQAMKTSIRLAAPFSFHHGLETYTAPPGRYIPAMEDDSGVYYRAPADIISSSPISAASVYEGGLYVPSTGSTKVETYIVVRSQLRFFELPADFRYSLDQ